MVSSDSFVLARLRGLYRVLPISGGALPGATCGGICLPSYPSYWHYGVLTRHVVFSLMLCEYGLLEVPPELGVLFVEAQRSLDRGISVAMEGGRLCGSPLAYMRDEDFLRRAVEQVERYRMREGRFNDEHHFRLLKLAKLPGCTFPMGFGIAAVNKDRLQGAVESTPPPTPPNLDSHPCGLYATHICKKHP
ncbi:hypothetical protein B0H14DRAFT_2564999 [Mycena olivaceomarginata]|nr:hypothetical protein B0H14DRAFT_2564999 [Mycena olivaceomarginata]